MGSSIAEKAWAAIRAGSTDGVADEAPRSEIPSAIAPLALRWRHSGRQIHHGFLHRRKSLGRDSSWQHRWSGRRGSEIGNSFRDCAAGPEMASLRQANSSWVPPSQKKLGPRFELAAPMEWPTRLRDRKFLPRLRRWP